MTNGGSASTWYVLVEHQQALHLARAGVLAANLAPRAVLLRRALLKLRSLDVRALLDLRAQVREG